MSLVPPYSPARRFVQYQTIRDGDLTVGFYFDSAGCTYITRETLESMLNGLGFEQISEE